MLGFEDIYSGIAKNYTQIQSFGIKRIGIFGSYSTGKANNASDIDILIEFYEEKKSFDNYMELKFYLEDLFNKEVDLVIADDVKEALKEEIIGSVKYIEAA